ncbi:electron transfer flavoprotein subunit alpha/FixB family protein [Rhizobium sp. CB3060]|uniref:electron transfer flavoprotein subunit alpha/FixB family protein n=1 Tax=Rhizobium sp. CB3060 TaxID=3138255 RepID=UPI004053C99A
MRPQGRRQGQVGRRTCRQTEERSRRDNSSLSDQTAKALTAASQIGPDVHILVAGKGARAAADAAAKLSGVSKVLLAESDALANNLAEPLADLIVSLSAGYDTIISAATSVGKNVLPRVAALLDVAQVSEIIEVISADTFKRPIYAGNAIQTVQASDARKVITVRTASFASQGEVGPAATVISVPVAADPGLSFFVRDALSASDRPELTSAKIILSGGRALGSTEKFKEVILPVADKLGAAVGASRAAVDAGYAPNDWQVGQTGKVVAPDLYIAAGISGAIQHLAGMKDSKVIVAINKDEEAPIFQVADYGLVADLFEALPELQEAIRDRDNDTKLFLNLGGYVRSHQLSR